MIRQTACGAAIAAISLLAGGCLVGTNSSVQEEGTKISGPTLAQIEVGKTTESWLVATAGEPTSRSKVDDHVQMLRYEHTETKKSGGYIFLIYAGGEKHKKVSTAIFEVTDGVVTRYWTEA